MMDQEQARIFEKSMGRVRLYYPPKVRHGG